MLTGRFQGGTAQFSFVPQGDAGGKVPDTMAGSGVTGGGKGTHSLTDQGGGVYRIETSTEGCVDGIPSSCRKKRDVITLRPSGGTGR